MTHPLARPPTTPSTRTRCVCTRPRDAPDQADHTPTRTSTTPQFRIVRPLCGFIDSRDQPLEPKIRARATPSPTHRHRLADGHHTRPARQISTADPIGSAVLPTAAAATGSGRPALTRYPADPRFRIHAPAAVPSVRELRLGSSPALSRSGVPASGRPVRQDRCRRTIAFIGRRARCSRARWRHLDRAARWAPTVPCAAGPRACRLCSA
jgi:hypothetical protein